ncbi:MAG: hypothetical protein Q8O30_01760 [Candidatus Omnitrophota bacterium]|nr:hypothetical protein [Candidatus Omnitrophota bacterium]
MNKKYKFVISFFEKYHKPFYYAVPLLAIIMISLVFGVFSIDKKVINKACLWDIAGRPYNAFLYDLNLPHRLNALFISGTPEHLAKIEKLYSQFNTGDIFTSQILSLLFGIKITEYSIAFYLNIVFCISAMLFSLLAGYLIFKNGYVSILLFLLINIFRTFCEGLFYGLPLRHAFAILNPLLTFCIIVFLIVFLKTHNKKYWAIFILSGFVLSYIWHCRTSEGYISIAALLLFLAVVSVGLLKTKKISYKKAAADILIICITIYAGYFGYQKMIDRFKEDRDKKFSFPKTEENFISDQTPFHSLFVSLFRYPNDSGYFFSDRTGIAAVYKERPDLEKKYSTDYFALQNSIEYNEAIKKLYFKFILNNPKYFATYLARSFYDYILFLPYYTWTGKASAHAYLPKISKVAKIAIQDLAPDFKDTNLNLIINLKPAYLPKTALFWAYFIFSYALLLEAVYAVFIKFGRSSNKSIGDNLPMYLLLGMLIYFFFASIIRIIIPVHGQGAVVAFNIIIIYNLVRISSARNIIRIKDKQVSAGAVLFLMISVSLAILTAHQIYRNNYRILHPDLNLKYFQSNINGWMMYSSTLTSVSEGQNGPYLQITAFENATGYIYKAFDTQPGEIYKFTVYFKKVSSASGQVKIGSSIDNPDSYYSGILTDETLTQHKGEFKANSPITYITLVNLTSQKGETVLFSDIILTSEEKGGE